MIKTILATAAALTLSAGVASATTLDFDTGNAIWQGGDASSNVLIGYEIDGLTFGISQVTFSGQSSSGANLFDTTGCGVTASCVGNDDGDLIPGVNTDGVGGNLLIQQQAGQLLDDDAAGNGSIIFTLLSGPAFSILGFSAIDDGTYSIANADGALGTLSPGANNATASMTFAAPSPLFQVGDSFFVNYIGSGGVDSIVLAPIPLPAGGLLLLAGLGGLAAARRRKTA